jgi:hypothetical protein
MRIEHWGGEQKRHRRALPPVFLHGGFADEVFRVRRFVRGTIQRCVFLGMLLCRGCRERRKGESWPSAASSTCRRCLGKGQKGLELACRCSLGTGRRYGRKEEEVSRKGR